MSATTESAAAEDGPAPLVISVVRGRPTAEELAGLVAVLAARAAGGADSGPGGSATAGMGPEQGHAGAQQAPRSGWTDRSRYVRGRHVHGPGGWRASALPH